MTPPLLVDADLLATRLLAKLSDAGVSSAAAAATTRAMMHASKIGVDSHGARLIEFYCDMVRDGKANPRPVVSHRRTAAATAVVDGDDGHGHLPSYEAMALAVSIARESGIGAVGVVRSSHYGAAGAYAAAAAEVGMIGFATVNTDGLVALFGGAEAFHGTNPLAFAAPVAGEKPWLLDMATSSIPWNRVLLYRSLGMPLPPDTGADGAGLTTEDAEAARMLMPVGGSDFGFKGAALAGVATLLSAILQGTALDHRLKMDVTDPDCKSPPNLGHFFLAIDPDKFIGRAMFDEAMRTYLAALRGMPSAPGAAPVMAPGDREWRVEAERARTGIPIDPDTARYLGLAG